MALGFPHYPTIQWFIMLFFFTFSPVNDNFPRLSDPFGSSILRTSLWESKLHAAQGAWDFSDEEEFSDDEEKVRFDKGRPLVIEPKH